MRQAAFSHPSARTWEAAWMALTEPMAQTRKPSPSSHALNTSQSPQETFTRETGEGVGAGRGHTLRGEPAVQVTRGKGLGWHSTQDCKGRVGRGPARAGLREGWKHAAIPRDPFFHMALTGDQLSPKGLKWLLLASKLQYYCLNGTYYVLCTKFKVLYVLIYLPS